MQNNFFSQTQLVKGCSWQERGFAGPVVFSEGGYQVCVKDGDKEFWPFLDITDEGVLKDHFCTCDEKEGDFCFHEAAAWAFIFKKFPTPLHVRLRDSLWNALCQIGAYRHGYAQGVLQGDVQTGFAAFSLTKKKIFSIKPLQEKGENSLRAIVIEKGESFWLSFALWWLELQESGEKYTIDYQYNTAHPLPTGVTIRFRDVEIEFFLATVNWPLIIPCLKNVESPLKTFEFSTQIIKKITYSVEKKEFYIEREEEGGDSLSKILVGEWNFFPKKGFCLAKMDSFLRLGVVPFGKINDFLHQYSGFVQKYLDGVPLETVPVKMNYSLYFDEERNLHIRAYVHHEGDLQESGVVYFGNWIFFPDTGFCCLEGLKFSELETKILKEEVSDFVSKNRHWLHEFDGFQTHIAPVEFDLGYTVSTEEVIFESTFERCGAEGYDFHEWVYFKGRGFYWKKVDESMLQVIFPGLRVPVSQISEFIRTRLDVLENIPLFFSSKTPLEKRGVDIYLNKQKRVVVEPKCLYFSQYENKKKEVFDDYTYVEGEGFCLIPPHLRIPPRYSTKMVIPEGEEEDFVVKGIEGVAPFVLRMDTSLQKPKKLILKINKLEPCVNKTLKEAWVLEAEYKTDLGVVRPFEIWQALHKGKKILFSSAGIIFTQDPRYDWLRNLPSNRWRPDGSGVVLSILEWMRLFVLEEIEESCELTDNPLWKRFQTLEIADSLNLDGFVSSLRSYQYNGVKWLWFLYCFRLGGLLCDEMGLGKTHQAMALMGAVHNVTPTGKFLVVCPTSVIFHWEDLVRKFLPSVRIYVYHGFGRSLEGFNQNYDVLLTSYGILRGEKKRKGEMSLMEQNFDLVIFDEIQNGKNSFSQTHKSLKSIKGKVRIGLTGTPIENNLFELKALLDLVLPGYMPTEAVFRETFVRPIEKGEGGPQKLLLSQLIRPFVLRRKKKDVLLELPEKTEEISHISFSEEQRILYKKVYEESKETGLQESDSFIHVFTLFSQLRQICDHPALYYKDVKNYKKYTSGKWDLFLELVQEALDSGQKVVVFSQYLGMIDIMQSHFKENGICFATIVGSTKSRKSQVFKFQNDPTCMVFIGSLQAAGVGIDLTAASIVIHYDRSWNPAKENQATDRVHRIGQSRGVQVFKFVTRCSIEEHIHSILEKKGIFIEAVLGVDDQNLIKVLSKENIFEVLRLIDIDCTNSSIEWNR